MRKHDEGYALPFVLVVMTVLIIIALGVMGYAQRNLEAQKNSIVRMQEKYAAAGPIEQILAAGESAIAVDFYQTEALRFKVDTETGILTVVSSQSADSDVWIFATMEPIEESGDEVFSYETGKLSVNGKCQLNEYKIVDKATADTKMPAQTGTGGMP